MKVTKELNKQLKALLKEVTPDLESNINRVLVVTISSNGDAILDSFTKDFETCDVASKYALNKSEKSDPNTLVYVVVPWGFVLVD